MLFRLDNKPKRAGRPRSQVGSTKGLRRSRSGSVMPMVAFALLFSFAFLAFAIDVMREILSVQEMKFAAKAAALSLLPLACLDANGHLQNAPIVNAADGSFTSQAMSNMQAELARINQGGWYHTIANDMQNTESGRSAVVFETQDLVGSSSAGQDKRDPYLKLTARHSSNEKMSFLFLPVRFAASMFFGGSPADLSDLETEIIQSSEIACQPATRLGAGAALASSDTKGQLIARARLAAFPLALNYDDFKRALQAAGNSPFSCTLHLSSPEAVQKIAANDMRAYFVNLRKGGSVSDYYFDAQNIVRVDDLIGLIEYFNDAQSAAQPVQIPAAIERGVQLDRFAAAVLENEDLAQAVTELPTNRSYIIPVVRNGVSPNTQCAVEGFALLKLNAVSLEPNICKFEFTLSESLPVPNTSCSPALKTLPALDGTKLPSFFDAAQNPFKPRNFDVSANTMEARKQGIVMAPYVSPRRFVPES